MLQTIRHVLDCAAHAKIITKYIFTILKGYCMNIGEYCPEQNFILHELASAIYYVLRGTIFPNIHAITLLLYSNIIFESKNWFKTKILSLMTS